MGLYANNALSTVSTYVDRAGLRQQLEMQLHKRIDIVNRKAPVLVVHGIGGAGKTQLVLHYVSEHRQDYSAGFWVEADSRDSLERDYAQIYQLLYDIPPNLV